MPKALCWTGLVIAILVLVIFVFDLAIGVPFQRSSLLLDVLFVVSATALGFVSWTTLKEQDKR